MNERLPIAEGMDLLGRWLNHFYPGCQGAVIVITTPTGTVAAPMIKDAVSDEAARLEGLALLKRAIEVLECGPTVASGVTGKRDG